ncbi:hypothetical protein ACLB2K_048490 [Fragaria x ananassa]
MDIPYAEKLLDAPGTPAVELIWCSGSSNRATHYSPQPHHPSSSTSPFVLHRSITPFILISHCSNTTQPDPLTHHQSHLDSGSSSSSTSQSFTQWKFTLPSESPILSSYPQPGSDPDFDHVATFRSSPAPPPPPLMSSTGLQELFHAAELQLSTGSFPEQLAALHLLERSLVPYPPSDLECPPEVCFLPKPFRGLRSSTRSKQQCNGAVDTFYNSYQFMSTCHVVIGLPHSLLCRGVSPLWPPNPRRTNQKTQVLLWFSKMLQLSLLSRLLPHRRSFLEKKGLTKEEIDEAFRRVPDPPPSAQATTANQADGQMKTTNVQAQNLQPAATATATANSTAPVGTLARYRFHWSHAILGVGLLAASGCGTAVLIKNVIIPRLRSWVRKVISEDDNDVEKETDKKPSLAEEAAAAAKSAAAAAADVAKASQEMLNSKTEERKYFGELMSLLDVQVQEMKSMSNSIRRLEGETRASRASLVDHEDSRLTVTKSKQQYVNGKAEYDMHSVQSFSAPASVEPSTAPHSKSYMEIMAMVQRGEKPPNVREIDDLPPNPNQPPSNPRLAPRAKPWELGQTQNNSSQVYQSQTSGEAFSSSMQDNGLNYLNGDSSVPWWQRKTPSITEIENEDEIKAASSQVVRQPVQRAWVPPQPPPVAMPEAAEAIRRPKPSVQRESLGNDQLVARSSSDVTDDLQRVTKISESGVIWRSFHLTAKIPSSAINLQTIQSGSLGLAQQIHARMRDSEIAKVVVSSHYIISLPKAELEEMGIM